MVFLITGKKHEKKSEKQYYGRSNSVIIDIVFMQHLS